MTEPNKPAPAAVGEIYDAAPSYLVVAQAKEIVRQDFRSRGFNESETETYLHGGTDGKPLPPADSMLRVAIKGLAHTPASHSDLSARELQREVEEVISAWAFAHDIDGAARNDLFKRLCAALSQKPAPALEDDDLRGLSGDVVRLVVAARRAVEAADWCSDGGRRRERVAALDAAAEAFASRVPWDDEPEDATPAPANPSEGEE